MEQKNKQETMVTDGGPVFILKKRGLLPNSLVVFGDVEKPTIDDSKITIPETGTNNMWFFEQSDSRNTVLIFDTELKNFWYGGVDIGRKTHQTFLMVLNVTEAALILHLSGDKIIKLVTDFGEKAILNMLKPLLFKDIENNLKEGKNANMIRFGTMWCMKLPSWISDINDVANSLQKWLERYIEPEFSELSEERKKEGILGTCYRIDGDALICNTYTLKPFCIVKGKISAPGFEDLNLGCPWIMAHSHVVKQCIGN